MNPSDDRKPQYPPVDGTQLQVGIPNVSAPPLVRKDVPNIPGYEFLRRLGKGGIPVQHRARTTSKAKQDHIVNAGYKNSLRPSL